MTHQRGYHRRGDGRYKLRGRPNRLLGEAGAAAGILIVELHVSDGTCACWLEAQCHLRVLCLLSVEPYHGTKSRPCSLAVRPSHDVMSSPCGPSSRSAMWPMSRPCARTLVSPCSGSQFLDRVLAPRHVVLQQRPECVLTPCHTVSRWRR